MRLPESSSTSETSQGPIRFESGKARVDVARLRAVTDDGWASPQEVSERSDGWLLELARCELKLLCCSSIPAGEMLFLTVAPEHFGLDLSLLAEVGERPTGDDHVGDDQAAVVCCSFYPEIPEETLSRLAEVTHLERRTKQRFDVRLKVGVSWKPDEPSVMATLQNYSDCGFCVLIPRADAEIDQLTLHIPVHGRQISIRAKCQWQLKVDHGRLLGCAVTDRKDAPILNDFAAAFAEKP